MRAEEKNLKRANKDLGLDKILDENLQISRKSKTNKKVKVKKRYTSSSKQPNYLRPIHRDVHVPLPTTPPKETKKRNKGKMVNGKKKTREQIEDEEYVQDILQKTSHVMHANVNQYGLKEPKNNKFKVPHLLTDDRAEEYKKHHYVSKTQSVPIFKFTNKDEETKISKIKKSSKKSKIQESIELAKALTTKLIKEPFLDFEKDLEIGDNFTIESILKDDDLIKWNNLKDEDDREDFKESHLKQLEKKFQYCHKDLVKKRSTKLINEPSLISLESIIQNHPSLKFLDHDLILSILKDRDINVFKEKKPIITK
eukprot:CAMPEP_0205817242 /NCGR_PEP_ID=MMETSP0205-20121125/23988_1 /ASSEMBLY_ACC=CAM_ASM_000278 /TAXON_ID=36767 /ORGANISM="Euplotes focardii, Strain TN1" /LENGTH=310 /DNA_ID=CAMNT_0053107309 /DNA_START=204 /DNA_END=1136 /DNA_ORIENTATION=-